MALHLYEIDLSPLSPDEKTALCERIETVAFNGIHWNPLLQTIVFSVYTNCDISLLKIPACCRLSRLS